MKTFDELTIEQQNEAIAFAKTEIQEALSLKIIESNRPTTEVDLDKLAQAAAEGGQYNDEGKPYVEKNDVPFYFLGGCV